MTTKPRPFPGRLVTAMAFYLGLDLGQSRDYTALAALEAIRIPTGQPSDQDDTDETPMRYELRHLERPERGTPYPVIVQRVKYLLETPQLANAEALVIDATGVGRAVLDMFRQAGLRVKIVPVTITAGNTASAHDGMYFVPKRDLVGVLEVLSQNRLLTMPSERKRTLPLVGILKAEMLNFKAKINTQGHDSYEAGGKSGLEGGRAR